MADKNFVVKNGLTAGSLLIDSATGSINTSTSGATQTKINLGVITSSTGSSILPHGTTAQRDLIPGLGYTRFNSDTNKIEVYGSGGWINVGSVDMLMTSPTGSLITPSGTTAQRDVSPVKGYLRYNTDTSSFEYWNGTAWTNISSGTGGGSGIIGLGDLTDVTLTNPIYRNVLFYNGLYWENQLLNLAQLGDVLLGEIAPGDILSWSGTEWVNITPSVAGLITGPTGSLILPTGTTAERDAVPQTGYLRYNTDLLCYEGWDGTAWVQMTSGIITINQIDGGTYDVPPGVPLDTVIDGGLF